MTTGLPKTNARILRFSLLLACLVKERPHNNGGPSIRVGASPQHLTHHFFRTAFGKYGNEVHKHTRFEMEKQTVMHVAHLITHVFGDKKLGENASAVDNIVFVLPHLPSLAWVLRYPDGQTSRLLVLGRQLQAVFRCVHGMMQ